MATSTLTLRMDDTLKHQVDSISHDLGLTTTAVFNVMAKRFVAERGFPLEVRLDDEAKPTETTRKAMVAAEARELGLIPDDSPTFTNASDLINYLDNATEHVSHQA